MVRVPEHFDDGCSSRKVEIDPHHPVARAGQDHLGLGKWEAGLVHEPQELSLQPTVCPRDRSPPFHCTEQCGDTVTTGSPERNDPTMQGALLEESVAQPRVESDTQEFLAFVSSQVDQSARRSRHRDALDFAPIDRFEPIHLMDPVTVSAHESVPGNGQVKGWLQPVSVETVKGCGGESTGYDVAADAEHQRTKE